MATRDGGAAAYLSAEAFRADLNGLTCVLEAIGGRAVAGRFVQPLLWQVGSFGFRTVSLDIRQNSTVVNRVLAELLALTKPAEPVAVGTPQWSERIRSSLSQGERLEIDTDRLSPEAGELLSTFSVIREHISSSDADAVGSFVLSMTPRPTICSRSICWRNIADFQPRPVAAAAQSGCGSCHCSRPSPIYRPPLAS
ncbi:hypothetical protein AJ88_17780 [Mesorhizobium amorphae CCBAU 01583]|nr:hypothetical protein AJ88_17780 [Mesorhizobium amorphae CCBAU 01583]